MSRIRALAASCSLLVSCAFLTTTAAANPLGFSYSSTTNVSLYGKPTGMLVTGKCNRYDPAFQAARAKGAEVLAYINPINRPDHASCALITQLYMGDLGKVPLWPYPSYGQRQAYANTRMTDIRVGSAWVKYLVSYVEKLMREGKVDGVFLDNTGARLYMPLAEYGTWSQAEKNAYTDGTVDLVRRLDAVRRAVKPSFIIVSNSNWDRGDTRGLPGEKYVDGVSIEHPKVLSAWHVKYAAKPFSNLGHRRVLIIANNASEAVAWSKSPGVTHVSGQSSYRNPAPPPVPFKNLD